MGKMLRGDQRYRATFLGWVSGWSGTSQAQKKMLEWRMRWFIKSQLTLRLTGFRCPWNSENLWYEECNQLVRGSVQIISWCYLVQNRLLQHSVYQRVLVQMAHLCRKHAVGYRIEKYHGVLLVHREQVSCMSWGNWLGLYQGDFAVLGFPALVFGGRKWTEIHLLFLYGTGFFLWCGPGVIYFYSDELSWDL